MIYPKSFVKYKINVRAAVRGPASPQLCKINSSVGQWEMRHSSPDVDAGAKGSRSRRFYPEPGTHSEYLLIRLRRRLAEGKLNLGRLLPGLRRTSVEVGTRRTH